MKFDMEDVNSEPVEKSKAHILFDKKIPKVSLTDEKKFRVATKGTAEDISRLLNFDYIEYNGIKPCIQEERAVEIDFAYRALQQTQRDLDIISTNNIQLEREYAKIFDAVSTFEVIKDAADVTSTSFFYTQEHLEA